MSELASWLNLAVLLVAAAAAVWLYVKSVQPTALEKTVGPTAYARCARYRLASSVLMFVPAACYVLYRYYPLPVPLALTFPWGQAGACVLASALAAPAVYLVVRGMRDAGRETMTPGARHDLCGGIYRRVRHPQISGAILIWWSLAFGLNSPFLVLLTFTFIPGWLWACRAEERDLRLRFGAAYDEYRRRTGLFLPRLW